MPNRFNPVLSPPFTPSIRSGKPVISPSRPQTQTPISTFTPSFKTPLAPSTSASSAKREFQQSKSKSQPRVNSKSKSKPKPSLALSCQSPDALSIHTLLDINHGTTVIQTNTLPLNHESSKIIQTTLPPWLASAFEIDPPCELICVDNDTTSSSSLKLLSSNVEESADVGGRKILLPLLCVYTTKAVYILQLSVLPNYSSNSADIIQGQIESIHEPFESYLQAQKEEHNDYHLHIQRVRPAPFTQLSNNNYDTNNIMMYNLSPFIPRGCIAVLISSKKKKKNTSTYKFVDDSDSENEDDIEEAELCYSQMVLYHGVDNDNMYGDNMDDNLGKIRYQLKKGRIGSVTKKKKQFNNITATDMNTLEPIVDFSFLPSSLSTVSSSSSSCLLWNGMTIALSTREGELYTLTPVIFHGMAIPKHILLDALNHLKKQRYKNGKENDNTSNRETMALTARNDNDDIFFRRNMAAIAYIKDVFAIVPDQQKGNDNKKMNKLRQQQGNFVVIANIFNHADRQRHAASWPIAIQGPVYTPSEPCVHEVTCLESLPPPPPSNNTHNDDDFTISTSGYTSSLLLARGDSGQCVQYVMIPSGVNCIPRFSFESSQDCNALDEVVENIGSLMEEIFLENDDDNIDNEGEKTNFSLQIGQEGGQKNAVIHIDPIDNSMIHHFSKFGVVTITTNVSKVMINRLRNIVSKTGSMYNEDEIKTKAWSTIDILQQEHNDKSECVAGVNISGDAKIGHILVAVLSDGETEAINLTAAQYLNEANNSDTNTARATVVKTKEQEEADEALRAMKEVPVLQEQIYPLLEKISSGLSGMSKIVGGSTQPRDITPGTVATFLSTKHSNEQNIVLHLRELHKVVTSRLPYLESTRKHQKQELKRLDDMMRNLERRTKATNCKRETIENNFKILSQRSTDILSTARELAPTVTKAEREYFKDIKRYETDSVKFEERLNELRQRCKAICEGIGNAQIGVQNMRDMNQEKREMCKELLEYQKQKLEESEIIIKRRMNKLKAISVARGIETKELFLN